MTPGQHLTRSARLFRRTSSPFRRSCGVCFNRVPMLAVLLYMSWSVNAMEVISPPRSVGYSSDHGWQVESRGKNVLAIIDSYLQGA